MNLGEPIFIFILAFILLGPKRTSDLARQVGKLMAEFRKASNDFKYQFNEEMRVAEQLEQQKKQEAERAALAASAAPAALPAGSDENTILPPLAAEVPGSPAAADEASVTVPYAISAISATTGEEHSIEDHPLLRVDVIPPMDGSPTDQTSTTSETPTENKQELQQGAHHG
ncbi:twin-arginine translocase TatA/TatE family subunit [Acidipila sp. EB88]|uniref:twin-arginine translocase TatA/TatE family subunit n=1 Tax=Acidipila sp. EB88 TaxID=2305226 RepID=UPI0013156DD7|nr:twin-arginine translocase TatA/TatE family subunit [Acidipila sp. EB88]